MKNRIILPVILLLIFASCDSKTKRQSIDVPKKQIPEALTETGSSSFIRYDADLVADLYEEIVDKSPELQTLEKKIGNLKDGNNDSTVAYEEYDSKNKRYYNNAEHYLTNIEDSILKKEMELIVKKSFETYSNKIREHEALDSLIMRRTSDLDDMHIVLKILKTLPLIETFQKENLPGKAPMQSYLKELERTIKETESMGKK